MPPVHLRICAHVSQCSLAVFVLGIQAVCSGVAVACAGCAMHEGPPAFGGPAVMSKKIVSTNYRMQNNVGLSTRGQISIHNCADNLCFVCEIAARVSMTKFHCSLPASV